MTDPVITMSSRLVEAKGYPWQPWQDRFSDPEVARDFVESLDAKYGPTAVNVEVTGGEAEERAAVEGLWLCGDGGTNVRTQRAAAWDYDEESWEWAGHMNQLDAWEQCVDACWLTYVAVAQGIDTKKLVAAACVCLRTVLRFLPRHEDRPLEAIEVCEAWAGGEKNFARLCLADRAMMLTGYGDDRAAEEVGAAASRVTQSILSLRAGRRNDAAAELATAIECAAVAITIDAQGGAVQGEEPPPDADALARFADTVRAHVTALEFLRSLRIE